MTRHGNWPGQPQKARHHAAAIKKAATAHQRAQAALWDAVAFARDDGVTWQAIADALNVSRQAATERFSKPPRRHQV